MELQKKLNFSTVHICTINITKTHNFFFKNAKIKNNVFTTTDHEKVRCVVGAGNQGFQADGVRVPGGSAERNFPVRVQIFY